MSTDQLTIDDVQAILEDMAGRRYMNAVAYLSNQDVREAVFEVGAAEGYRQALIILERARQGEAPGDSPDERYQKLVRLMQEVGTERSDQPEPTIGFS